MEERLLSQASKVLLKAIVQAIFTFGMSCIKLPVGLRKDIVQCDVNFGGVNGGSIGKFTRRIEKLYVDPKLLDV